MRKSNPTTIDLQATIKRLELELGDARRALYLTRHAMVEMMPEEKRQLLQSFSDCNSSSEKRTWQDKIAAELVVMAETIATGHGERAYCPLCGGGTLGPYEVGFSIPLGLTRHLTGWGNARECPVMTAALAIAKESWDSPFPRGRREQETVDTTPLTEAVVRQSGAGKKNPTK